jgi:dipicolinate synthase subunit A
MCEKKGLTLIDYFEREELTVVNAAITAEGAIEIIMREKAKAVMSMNILITGYGRIAKVLAGHLRSLGANVTICARKVEDLTWARISGCSAVHFGELDTVLGEFDTVVNTVPAVVFSKSSLARLKSDCLLVDLATKSGVEGMELTKTTSVNAGAKVIWALSLPGKIAPITAGEIIADTILNITLETEKRENEKGGDDNE